MKRALILVPMALVLTAAAVWWADEPGSRAARRATGLGASSSPRPTTIEPESSTRPATAPGSDLRVVPERQYLLLGQVVDDLGRPMPNRKLDLRCRTANTDHEGAFGGGSRSVHTDSLGRFRVRGLPQGIVHADGAWDGYEPVACDWAPGDPEPTLVAKRRPTVRGRVLDPDGRPVRAAIQDARLGHALRTLGTFDESDAEGWFELTGLDSGEVSLIATALGLESEAHALLLEPGSVTENVIFRLNPRNVVHSYLNVRLRGRDDQPVPGIRMHWMRQAWRPRATRTDQFGVALLPPPKSSILMMIGGGYTPPPARSDGEGVFRFTFDLPPGTPITIGNRVDASGDAPRYLPTLLETITSPDADAPPIELRLRGGVVRRLRVRPARMADSLVLVGPALPLGVRDGEASFLVDPDTAYLILARDIFNPFVVRSRWNPPRADLVTEIEVPDRTEDESNPRTIRGRILDESGKPVPGVTIEMVEGAPTGVADSAMTLADGSFAVSVRGSELHLQFAKSGYGTVIRRYRAGEPWPEAITLPATARIRVAIAPPGNFRAADWRLALRAAGWTQSIDHQLVPQARDRFSLAPAMHLAGFESDPPFLSQGVLIPGSIGELDQLPPGRLELRLWTDGYELKRSIRLVAGVTRTLTFAPR